MSNSRQRMLDAFNYNHPDKIPLVYHPSPAGLLVHGQKLLDLFNAYPPDNPITFDALPVLAPGTIDPDGRYHELKVDAWGTQWEFRIFGVQGHPKTYPFNSWKEAREYTFPPLSSLVDLNLVQQRQEYLIFGGGVSIFERLHALRPIDEVLMDLAAQDPDLLAFLDRFVEYWLGIIQACIDAGVDVITFGDDWGTQTSTLVSPRLFNNIFKPRYAALMAPVKQAGRKVFFHSCGYLGHILDELFDLGIDGLWPQITLAEADPDFPHKCKEHRVAIYIHPDRQRLIPLGSPQEIEGAIRTYAERYHRLGGGGIFYVEMENDAPFENVEALFTAIDRYR